jgi:hypothetical protein
MEKHKLKQSRYLSWKKYFVGKKFCLFSITNLFRLGFILYIRLDASYSNLYINKEAVQNKECNSYPFLFIIKSSV